MIHAELNSGSVLSEVWHHAQEGLAALSPEGTVLAANPSLCTALGYDERQLVGKTIADVSANAADLDIDLQKFSELARGEIEQYEFVKTFAKKDRNTMVARMRVFRGSADRLIMVGSVVPVDRLEIDALPAATKSRIITQMIADGSLTEKTKRTIISHMVGSALVEFWFAHWRWILGAAGALILGREAISALLSQTV